MKIKKSDRKFFMHNSGAVDISVSHSKGSYLYDTNGKEYIDFVMGWCVGNLGWGNDVIAKAIKEYDGPGYVYPNLTYKPWLELAELLADITPGKLVKSFRATGGTESVETALQIAMAYTGRSKFLSVEDSYHGNSIAALSIGSSANKKKFDNLLSGCYKIKTPLDEKAIQKAEARLKNKDIAAFIMEPVICNLAVEVPEQKFMDALQRLCKKYGTLLIMDEVAAGFGRTGKLFASEHFNIEPDIMCISKALSGGYAGIGATLTTGKIAKAVESKIHIYSTYGWHPVSVAAAIANIQYLKKHKTELLSNVSEISALFHSRLSEMKFKKKIKLRIKGLAIAVNVDTPAYAKSIKEKCLKNGLILTVEGGNLVMFPALNITKEEAEKGLHILESCI